MYLGPPFPVGIDNLQGQKICVHTEGPSIGDMSLHDARDFTNDHWIKTGSESLLRGGEKIPTVKAQRGFSATSVSRYLELTCRRKVVA